MCIFQHHFRNFPIACDNKGCFHTPSILISFRQRLLKPPKFLRNSVPLATKFILALNPEITAISVISYAEILTGLDEKEARKARPLLQSFELLEINAAVAEKAADMKILFLTLVKVVRREGVAH